MKCHPVNKVISSLMLGSAFLISCNANASIENTIIADYNFASGEIVHHTLLIDSNKKESMITLIPLDEKDSMPSVFRITACFNRQAGQSTNGEIHITPLQTNENDTRLVNFSDFVKEHNLAVWWTPLGNGRTLVHNIDPSGIIILNPENFLASAKKCHTR